MFRRVAVVATLILGTTGSFASAQVVVLPTYPGRQITFAPHQYRVQYLVTDWNERSFSSPFAAREFELFKRSQGFETSMVRHGHHIDVRYGLPVWQTYRTVSTHHAAHDLERYLERRGFEARVVHH